MSCFPAGLSLTLVLGLATLPAVARAEDPPVQDSDSPPLKLALDLGGALGRMNHPAALLPPTPVGVPRSTSGRDSAGRVTFGIQLALSQFFNVENLWESNALDWYLVGGVRVFSLR